MSFGTNLKKIRTEKSYTQEQFAEAMGVSRQAVSLWESDNGYPEVEKLLDIVKLFDVSLDWLFFDRKENEIKTVSSDGKITVFSATENVIVRCNKVASTQQFKNRDNEPEYALFAEGGNNDSYFNASNRTIIGWYKNKEALAKEIAEIHAAITEGQNNYTLKYSSPVKKKGLTFQFTEK